MVLPLNPSDGLPTNPAREYALLMMIPLLFIRRSIKLRDQSDQVLVEILLIKVSRSFVGSAISYASSGSLPAYE